MVFYGSPDNCQAKTGPTHSHFFCCKKGLENFFNYLLGNAPSRIADRQDHIIPLLYIFVWTDVLLHTTVFSAYGYGSSFAVHGFNRVENKIRNRIQQARFNAHDRQQIRGQL